MTGPHHVPTCSRRRLIAAGAAATVVPLAGCSAIADWIGDLALGDVNVANATDSVVAGSVRVVGPDGDVALEESFDLQPDSDDDGSDSGGGGGSDGDSGESDGNDEESQATFDDVWTASGDYEVELQVDEGADAVGSEGATETATIENPDEEKLLAVLGDPELDEPIRTFVFEDVSELQQYEQ